jgi:type I restriction enzyme S subunit
MSGGTPSRSNNKFWKGTIPWASPKDMKVEVLTDTLDHLSKDGVEAGSRIAPINSIFIVIRGMILAHTFPIAIAGVPIAFNQDMKALVVLDEFYPQFIFYWLQSKSGEILNLVSDSTHGTKRLPTDSLFNMQVPCLTLDEQKVTIETLQKCDQTLKHLQEHIRDLVQLKNRLLQVLL